MHVTARKRNQRRLVVCGLVGSLGLSTYVGWKSGTDHPAAGANPAPSVDASTAAANADSAARASTAAPGRHAFRFVRRIAMKFGDQSPPEARFGGTVETVSEGEGSFVLRARLDGGPAGKARALPEARVVLDADRKVKSLALAESSDPDARNLVRDLVTQFAFFDTRDTTGAYDARFTPIDQGMRKEKISYQATASPYRVRVGYSRHEWSKRDSLIRLRGEDRLTFTSVADPAEPSLESVLSYDWTEVAATPARALAGQRWINDRMKLEETSSPLETRSLADYAAWKKAFRGRIEDFRALVRSLDRSPEVFAQVKADRARWLADRRLFRTLIGALASSARKECQGFVVELLKEGALPEAGRVTAIAALASTEQSLVPETQKYLVSLAESPAENLAERNEKEQAWLTLASQVRKETSDEARRSLEDRLAAHFAEEKDPGKRLDLVGNSGSTRFLSEVKDALGSQDAGLRAKGALALRFMPKQQAVVALAESVRTDRDARVQKALRETETYWNGSD